MKTRQVFKTDPEKGPVSNTFNVWKNNRNQKIEVLGTNSRIPFNKGNKILVDGKEMRLAKVQIHNKEVSIVDGRISEVKALKTFIRTVTKKPSGKKMIGIPKVKPTAEKKKESLSGEKMIWIKKLK